MLADDAQNSTSQKRPTVIEVSESEELSYLNIDINPGAQEGKRDATVKQRDQDELFIDPTSSPRNVKKAS